MKILITGASGFVGKNLMPYLYGYEVEAISRHQLNNITSEHLDNADVIIHLAGKAHDLRNNTDAEEYYQVNFMLTKRLYDAFLKSKAKKFIFVSTVKAAADKLKEVLTENTVANPLTDYGKSKLMAEQYIKSHSVHELKSYYILRPCMIHGPGNKGNLTLLYKLVDKRIPYPLAAFTNSRSFLSITNLNMVIEALIKGDIKSGIYNVADDQPLSTTAVIQIIAEVLGFKPKLWKVNPGLVSSIAKIGDYIKLPLNSERLRKMTESYIVSNDKIKHALNIKEFPISSKNGLINTIKNIKGE